MKTATLLGEGGGGGGGGSKFGYLWILIWNQILTIFFELAEQVLSMIVELDYIYREYNENTY
jgi:hypothetical protein